jgi:hypothetical protein
MGCTRFPLSHHVHFIRQGEKKHKSWLFRLKLFSSCLEWPKRPALIFSLLLTPNFSLSYSFFSFLFHIFCLSFSHHVHFMRQGEKKHKSWLFRLKLFLVVWNDLKGQPSSSLSFSLLIFLSHIHSSPFSFTSFASLFFITWAVIWIVFQPWGVRTRHQTIHTYNIGTFYISRWAWPRYINTLGH